MQIGKAQALLQARKYEAAMEAAEDALKVDPSSVRAQMILARAATEAGHKGAALVTYEDLRAAKAGGNKKALVEALREMGFLCETMDKRQQAKEVWEEVKRLHSADPDADTHMKNLYATDMTKDLESAHAKGGKGSIAREMLKSKDATEKLDAQEGAIRTQDDVARHIEITKDDIKKHPEDPRLYAKLGDFYKRAENYAEAKKAYEEAMAKDEVNPQWRFKMDDLEIWRITREVNELARKFKAGDASARETYNREKAELMELKLNSYLEREKQYSTDGRIRYELGIIFFDLAESKKDSSLYDESIRRFQGIYADPNYRHEAGLRMGLGFARKEQYELALKRFDDTLATLEFKDIRWKNLVYAKADTLERAGRQDESLKTFLLIYELDVSFKDVTKRVETLQKAGAKA